MMLVDHLTFIWVMWEFEWRMRTGAFGIPRESYGASNDARGRFGPPPWSKAKFDLASGATEVQKIDLAHP